MRTSLRVVGAKARGPRGRRQCKRCATPPLIPAHRRTRFRVLCYPHRIHSQNRSLIDKWAPLALFVSANVLRGPSAIVKLLQDVNAKSVIFSGTELKENQGLRLDDLMDLYEWLRHPGITLSKLEVNTRVRLMKTKLFLFYLVASPGIPADRVHHTIRMLPYAISRSPRVHVARLAVIVSFPVPLSLR
jgi:hypothetical protein